MPEFTDGVAQAFILGEDHMDTVFAALILSDNIFHGGNILHMKALPFGATA